MKDRRLRVLALAGTLVVLLLAGSPRAGPDPAPPAEMPASERSRLALVTATASLATHAAGEPFVARREVFEYLLDHPEFAAHLTRTLRIARYRIWREPDGLWLDDGWGTVGRFAVVDRKSTRLNSSHLVISYAVFCLKKKKRQRMRRLAPLRIRVIVGSCVCVL